MSKPTGLERIASKVVRVCRYMNHCDLCNQTINAGETYHDGGHGMRAHVKCVKKMLEQTTGGEL